MALAARTNACDQIRQRLADFDSRAESQRQQAEIDAQRAALAQEQAEVTADLGKRGRVLIRPSGTEPLLRVMVEASDAAMAKACAERLVQAVQG